MIRLDAAPVRSKPWSTRRWTAREPVRADLAHYHIGLGRELFAPFRAAVGAADQGAAVVGQLAAA